MSQPDGMQNSHNLEGGYLPPAQLNALKKRKQTELTQRKVARLSQPNSLDEMEKSQSAQAPESIDITDSLNMLFNKIAASIQNFNFSDFLLNDTNKLYEVIAAGGYTLSDGSIGKYVKICQEMLTVLAKVVIDGKAKRVADTVYQIFERILALLITLGRTAYYPVEQRKTMQASAVAAANDLTAEKLDELRAGVDLELRKGEKKREAEERKELGKHIRTYCQTSGL